MKYFAPIYFTGSFTISTVISIGFYFTIYPLASNPAFSVNVAPLFALSAFLSCIGFFWFLWIGRNNTN